MSKNLFGALGAIAVFCGLAPSSAGAVTIGFDELAPNTLVTNQYAADGILFSSTGGGVRVFSFSGADTPPNTIGGTDAAGNLDFSQPVEFSFFDGGVATTTDFVSVAFTDLQLTSNSLTAYDINGNLLLQAYAPCAADFSCNPIEIVSVSYGGGIHRIVLDGAGGRGQGDVAFDTITFNPIKVSEVPLPAALPMFLVGLAGLGLRKKAKQAA